MEGWEKVEDHAVMYNKGGLRKFGKWIERAEFMFHCGNSKGCSGVRVNCDDVVGSAKAVNACACIIDDKEGKSEDSRNACVRHQESQPPGWVRDSSARGKSTHVETYSDVSQRVKNTCPLRSVKSMS